MTLAQEKGVLKLDLSYEYMSESYIRLGDTDLNGFVREGVLRRWVVYPARGWEPQDSYSYYLPENVEEYFSQ